MSDSDKLSLICSLIEEYIDDKHKRKSWTPGVDWVRYSGPYFSSDEYVSATKSLLNEWLVLGEDSIKFENKFPKYFGKKHGILTNSGSSANLLMMLALTSKRLYNLPKGTKVITPVAGFPTKTCAQERVIRSFREWGRGCYCVGKKANLLKNGMCKKRFNTWLPSLPTETFDHKYVYEEIGYNLKPIELQASIGLAQLKKIDIIDSKRKENYKRLYNFFEKYEEFFILPKPTAKSDPSWFAFPITIKDESPFARKDIVEFFENNKIQTRTYFAGNILLQPAYTHLMNPQEVIKKFPVARKVTTDTFFLGTSPVITMEQIAYIEQKLHEFMKDFL